MLKRDRSIIIFIALLLYRIPLSRIIGDSGMGFLSGPMEFFICMLFAFGSGISTTMQGMMYDRIRREQYRNAGQVYRLGRRYTVIISFLLLAACILPYQIISKQLLAEPGQRLAFLLVGPAIFLGLYIRLNIGYLVGTENGQAAVIGQLIESVLIGVFMIWGAYIGIAYGQKVANLLLNEEVAAMYGALGVMAGLCAGEVITLLVLMVMTIIYQRSFRHMIKSDSSRRTEYNSDISMKLMGGIVKDGLQNLFIQLPVIILIVIYRRYALANEISDANAAVGAFYSKYLIVIGIISAIAVMCVPGAMRGIAAAINDSDEQTTSERITIVFGRIMYFAIPASVFITMLSPVIVKTFFVGRTSTAESLLTMGSSCIVIYSVMYLILSVLLKLGYSLEMLFVSAVSLIISFIGGIILISKKAMEFKGAVLILILYYLIITAVGLFILFRNYRLKLRIMQYILIPLVVSGIIGIIIKLIGGALITLVGPVLTFIICIVPAWFVYNIACMFLRVVSAGAMERKFMGHILVHIGQSMGVY